jgi:hypothetical protein
LLWRQKIPKSPQASFVCTICLPQESSDLDNP